MIQTLLIFLIFLGPLVFFHELGHFLFARFFGVRVEVFSIGFGPKIFKKKIGDTEYAASIIPLGGYVKMFGDNPLESDKLSDEDKKVSYTHKSKFAKFWIVFGGPLANFILAFVIYFFLVIGGEKVTQARLGVVKKDSSHYIAGLRTGDILTKINETEIIGFDDLNMIDSSIKSLTIDRNGELKLINVAEVKSEEFLKELSKSLTGLKAPIFLDGNGNSYLANTETKVNKMSSLENLSEKVNKTIYLFEITSELKDIQSISNIKFNEEPIKSFDLDQGIDFIKTLKNNGYYLNELAVNNVSLGSPAAKAGLQKGDLIHSVSGISVASFTEVQKLTQDGKEKSSISYKVLRSGELKEFFIAPEIKNEVALIGVASGIIPFSSGLIETKSKGFAQSLSKALYRTKDGIKTTFMGFKKLIFGEVSIKNIGGPFAIANVAANSFSISYSMFFRLMALISINLGLINLFPIPVLDGGHIVMLGIEAIYGGPLPKNILMRMQQVGVSLLFVLMFVAIFNDVSRFFQ